MYKILFIDKFNNQETRKMEFIPRRGDTLPFFYQPYPKVTGVLLFANEHADMKKYIEDDKTIICTVN